VRDEAELALAATRRLPATALEGLREAFATEVAERLPRLVAAARSGDPVQLAAVVRDAHTLGSSSAVLGEPDASRAARAAEALLLDWHDGALGPLRAAVDELEQRLAGWLP
jgi:HPt (histidine-containing phosphotransfer) domain-containing protein